MSTLPNHLNREADIGPMWMGFDLVLVTCRVPMSHTGLRARLQPQQLEIESTLARTIEPGNSGKR